MLLTLLVGLLHAVVPELLRAQTSAVGARLSDYGAFLGLDMRFGDMAGEFAAFAGGDAAIVLKRKVYLGIRGAGLATDNAEIPATGATPAQTLGWSTEAY